MAQVSGQGTIWNLPNYSGELYTADLISAPILSMLGGLGRLKIANNFEFATSSEYDFPTEAQPDISETGSLTAPTASEFIRNQVKNVIQIHQESIKISDVKLANSGRLSGINSVGSLNNVSDEVAAQINWKLLKIARDIEESILNGAYQISTAANVSNKTRGLLAACDLTGGTSVDASSAALSKNLVDELLRTMFLAGAPMMNPVVFGNGIQIEKLNDIYGYQPDSYSIGGVSVKQIFTPYGTLNVAAPHRFMDTDKLLVVDLNMISSVGMNVPGKGNFYVEDLAKTGASVDKLMTGFFGLDHGPAFAHGKIINLATS